LSRLAVTSAHWVRDWLSWLLAGLLAASAAWADRFEIDSLSVRLRDGVYRFDARIEYEFSEAALEALDNGVPLYLDVQVQLRRDDAWFWERSLVSRQLRYMIRFQPLSELFQVNDLQREVQQNFATRRAAISALGDLSDLKLITADKLVQGDEYQVRLRAALDIGALPLPMQPLAYLSPAWELSSDWRSWPLQP
jgi:hypothetical protein